MLASGQSPGAMESTREATNVPSFQSVVRLVNFLSGSLSCVNEKKPGRGQGGEEEGEGGGREEGGGRRGGGGGGREQGEKEKGGGRKREGKRITHNI